MEENTLKSGRQIIAFGILMSINFPLYLLIWHRETSHSYHNHFLRLIATVLCLGLVFKKYWPNKIKPPLSVYWYFVILFTLPFFFVFMTLKNHISTLWLMNLMSALFFVLLLLDIVSALSLLIIGSLVAGLAYMLTTSGTGLHYYSGTPTLTGIFVTFTAAIIIGGLFSKNREMIGREKLQTMMLLGFSIAHELRTPLLSIASLAEGLKKYLPNLLEFYKNNSQGAAREYKLSRRQILLFDRAPQALAKEVRQANLSIDMMLMNLKAWRVVHKDPNICNIEHTVNEALTRYPFCDSEDGLITVNLENNFTYQGEENLVIHALLNLLKNALFFIKAEGHGEITIKTVNSDNSKYNILVFEDTAKGIPKQMIRQIFGAFQSKREGGTGIGLAFCKMVMQGMGGDITCKSEEGEYTRFIFCFPTAN